MRSRLLCRLELLCYCCCTLKMHSNQAHKAPTAWLPAYQNEWSTGRHMPQGSLGCPLSLWPTKWLHICVGCVLQIGRLQREGRISSDEQHTFAHDVQKMTDQHVADIDGLIQAKTEDLTSPWRHIRTLAKEALTHQASLATNMMIHWASCTWCRSRYQIFRQLMSYQQLSTTFGHSMSVCMTYIVHISSQCNYWC